MSRHWPESLTQRAENGPRLHFRSRDLGRTQKRFDRNFLKEFPVPSQYACLLNFVNVVVNSILERAHDGASKTTEDVANFQALLPRATRRLGNVLFSSGTTTDGPRKRKRAADDDSNLHVPNPKHVPDSERSPIDIPHSPTESSRAHHTQDQSLYTARPLSTLCKGSLGYTENQLYVTATISPDCSSEGACRKALLVALQDRGRPKCLNYRNTGLWGGEGKRLRVG
jgi:hypothetical protein